MKKKVIPIIYALDEFYAPYAAASIASLVANSSRAYFYEIGVLHTDLSASTSQKLLSMSADNYRVSVYDVSRYIEKERGLLYTNFHFSVEMFYRILIPDVFPQYKKVVYLDTDTVVLGDISKLYETDIDGFLLGGVVDLMHKRAREYVTSLGIDPGRYINSGVLLINCEQFREQGIKAEFFAELSHRRSLRYPDQDIINLICRGRIKELDHRYNYTWHYSFLRDNPELNLTGEDLALYRRTASDIAVLHYTGAIKPWNNRISPLADYFWHYLEGTPFLVNVQRRYEKIPNKEYVAYRFLDFIDGGIRITATLQSLTGMRLSDLSACGNGEKYGIEKGFTHIIEIDGRTYERSSFSFFISDIREELFIRFYNKKSGEELMSVCGLTFPLDFSVPSYLVARGLCFFRKSSALFITDYSAPLEKSLKKRLNESLKKNKNDPQRKKALLLRRLYGILSHLLRKDIWLISDRADKAGDNGEVLFEHLCKHPIKFVRPYFVLDRKSGDRKRIKKIGRVVSPDSKYYKILFLLSKRVISSQLEKGIIHPIDCERYLKDILYDSKTVFLQHGIIKDDLSSCYNRFEQNMDIFVTSAKSEYSLIVNNSAYGCPSDITRLIGLTRFDRLEDKRERLILIMPTWRKGCITDFNTGRVSEGFENTDYFTSYYKLLHDERLLSAARENGYKICFYQHPLMQSTNTRFLPLDEVFVDFERYSYSEAFSKGALLVTDYSSVQYDFAYLSKPIIYFHFDKEDFYSSHTYREGGFDYQNEGFGEVASSLDELVTLIVRYIQDGCGTKQKYLARMEDFFEYRDRENCRRTVEAILEL